MLKIEIHESTPANMLRAIKAACGELLKSEQAAQHNSRAAELHAAAEAETDKAEGCLTAHNEQLARGGLIEAAAFYRVGEQPSEQTVLANAFDAAVEQVGAQTVAAALATDGPNTDSSGAEWNPELHASTKAKNQDGTWKKRRGAGKETDAVQDMGKDPLELSKEQNPQVARDLPPLPPAPPAAPLVTMNDIYALITNNKCVLNDVIAAVQAMGFADVGAFSRDATPEQRAQLLQELTA